MNAIVLRKQVQSGIILAALLTTAHGSSYGWAQKTPRRPNLGSNVLIVGPNDDKQEVQSRFDAMYAQQAHSEFGNGRYAILFEPGRYTQDVPVGFYTEVAGLGMDPDDVQITGNVHSDAASRNNNATTTFWRGIANLRIQSEPKQPMLWAVSQGTFLRRIHLAGDLTLHQQHGWASGGWLSDSVIDGNVDSGSQQQWISRNDVLSGWTGSNWNMVFVGVQGAPAGDFPHPPFTRVERTPVVREKPFLCVRRHSYGVFVPSTRAMSVGVDWKSKEQSGKFLPLDKFYVADPRKDTAASINTALRAGKNLLLTPGTYELSEALHVQKKDTVILGLGFATLHASASNAAIEVEDVDGVSVSGLIIDAGEVSSPVLLEVGTKGKHHRHIVDPPAFQDISFRIGGAVPGRVDVNLAVYADDTIIDNVWIWRADHGKGVGWEQNISNTGLLVDGDHVTAYGLFVEHHQKYQVLWKGEAGKVFFYQSELPYEVPNQDAWRSASAANGWAAYKVADEVKHHEAWGLGVYSVFRHPDIKLDHAIEAPLTSDVRFHDITTVSLVGRGEITHLVNDVGLPTVAAPKRIDRTLTTYPVDDRTP